MCLKINTMKHFVALAALLTSLSAFAQLPYNPDANNDGQIGAYDLTALLSVYSNTFSNGILSNDATMAYYIYFSPTQAQFECGEVCVCDLYQHGYTDNVNVEIGIQGINGETVDVIIPPGFSGYIYVGGTVKQILPYYSGRLARFVYWNGNVHELIGY